MKVNKTISLDVEVAKKANKVFNNVSDTINRLLREEMGMIAKICPGCEKLRKANKAMQELLDK